MRHLIQLLHGGTGGHFRSLLVVLCLSIAPAGGVFAEEEYHTPLAGEAYRTEVAGKEVYVPPRDRDDVRSLSVGGTIFSPRVGNDGGVPFGAFYWLRDKDQLRSRAVIGLFVNEIDLARHSGSLELLGHWDNNTIPFPTAEIIDGREITSTSVLYGSFSAGLGIGYRAPVPPFNSDNLLRLQLLYNTGYLYTGRVAETGKNVRLPPSTLVHGFRFRATYDGLQRNIMELPHDGWAGGLEVELGRRNHWSDHTFGGTLFSGTKTRDFIKASAFFTGASGISGLSDRHKLIGIIHGAYAPEGTIDRYSAFRVGGGPFPYETDDLYRYWYPGAMFNQFPASDFVVASLEYRYEILFFLYLHLRATLAEVNRPYFRQESPSFTHLDFIHDYSSAFSLGVTSGLPFNSQIYTEYSYDSRILRNGVAGSSFLVLWCKSF